MPLNERRKSIALLLNLQKVLDLSLRNNTLIVDQYAPNYETTSQYHQKRQKKDYLHCQI
jgi:hypothetical protein